MSLNSIDRAYIAKDAYSDRSREAAAMEQEVRQVKIGGEWYEVIDHVNTRSGYQGTAYRSVETGEVVIAHRGTEFNPLSKEFLRDMVRADGGMVAKSINVQTPDAIAFTDRVLKEVRQQGTPIEMVSVAAHSLGGTLAQITAHRFHLKGETFNAYGAAGLGYGIPEGGSDVVNHIDAADFVSARPVAPAKVTTHSQDIQETDDMKLSQIAATAALAAGALTACEPDKPVFKHNPNPKERYEITAMIQGAPGPLELVGGGAKYAVMNYDCLGISNDMAGHSIPLDDSIDFDFRGIADNEYQAEVAADLMIDEDYNGKGVCHWEVIAVGPTFKSKTVFFGAILDLAELRAQKPKKMYYSKRAYFAEESFSDSGESDPSGFLPEVQNELFTITLTPRRISP